MARKLTDENCFDVCVVCLIIIASVLFSPMDDKRSGRLLYSIQGRSFWIGKSKTHLFVIVYVTEPNITEHGNQNSSNQYLPCGSLPTNPY